MSEPLSNEVASSDEEVDLAVSPSPDSKTALHVELALRSCLNPRMGRDLEVSSGNHFTRSPQRMVTAL